MNNNNDNSYLLRTVTFSIVFVMIINIITVVWFASSIDTRIEVLEIYYEKMSGVHVKQDVMRKQVNRIERKLDKVLKKK